MLLCSLSRRINRRLGGRDEMLCSRAFREKWRSRHALDLTLYLRDGPDHCLRMFMAEDTTGWGVSVRLPVPREGL